MINKYLNIKGLYYLKLLRKIKSPNNHHEPKEIVKFLYYSKHNERVYQSQH
jgi:hypothetical protein